MSVMNAYERCSMLQTKCKNGENSKYTSTREEFNNIKIVEWLNDLG